ncbi:MAG TPA: LuxR C-terminal-related transcriptional regulator [Candidatus Limnocylindria bacterium]|nr:LuxR C-terminal-related transcriptional regulator [Candidatus Limnocylindria bacterium]
MELIGRERELAALAAALQRASDGQPSRLVMAGPMGMGVSRLLDELCTRLADVESVVLCRGRAAAPRSGLAYSSIAHALAGPLAALPDERLAQIAGQTGHDLASLMPALAPRLAELDVGLEPPPLEAPDQRGARVQESLLGVLERLAGDGVVCLMLEDLEEADPGTREFVEALLRVSRRLPLALVLSYHPDELQRSHSAWRFVRGLEDSRAVEKLELAPLSREELLRLVEGLLGERPSLSFMAAIMEGSRGNPLLAGQLVAARRELEGVRLSDPLEEILHARLDRLEAGTLRVLRLLAAAHRPLTDKQLLEADLADGHLTRLAVSRVPESNFVREAEGGLEVIHELLAEAIESLALPAERQAMHAALARLPAAEPAEAAWHWDAAMRPAEARAAHLEAAQAALLIEPGYTALAHYQRVLELHDSEAGGPLAARLAGSRGPERDAEAAILAAAAAAADAAGSFRRAATLIEQAIHRRAGGRVERLGTGAAGTAASAELRTEVGELCERLGRYQRAGGDSAAGRRALETALKVIPPEPSVARSRALASLAQDLMLEGRFDASAEQAQAAIAAASAVGDAALTELGHATCTLGVDVAYLGELERGLELLEEATLISRRAGRLDDVVRSYANRTTLLDLDSRREAALAVVKEGIAEADRGGLGLTYGAFLRGNAADILFQLGRWQESELECRAAMEFPPAGVAWFSPILYLSLVLVESRADEEAARLVGRTLLQLEAVPAGQWSALVQRAAVSLALWRGDVADARQAAAHGWERVLETGDAGQIAASASTVLEACAASADAGREKRDWATIADAGDLAQRVLPLAIERVAASDMPPSLGARREAELHLATARAHAARLRGRAQPETWAELAEAWNALPIPYQEAKARWWQAAVALEARDRRAEARDALREAWRIAGELPARPLRRALLELAGRGRIPLPDDGPVAIPVSGRERSVVSVSSRAGSGHAIAERLLDVAEPPAVDRFGLSPRESAVLNVLAEGRTNREIAERLFISERTVAVHVRRILAKLGVSGRVEAAGLAIRLGLVPDEPLPSAYPGGMLRH